MTRMANEFEHADHERDLRKHDLRPTAINAVEVAALVKLVPIEQGAALIEDYARCEAAGARLDGVIQGSDRAIAEINKFSKVRR